MVIKLKQTQNSHKTQEEIKKNIKPTISGVTGIKNSALGKIILECKNTNSKCAMEQIEKKLGNNYDVKIPKKKHPCIKIIGVSEAHKDEIIEKIIKQNIFLENHMPKRMNIQT